MTVIVHSNTNCHPSLSIQNSPSASYLVINSLIVRVSTRQGSWTHVQAQALLPAAVQK